MTGREQRTIDLKNSALIFGTITGKSAVKAPEAPEASPKGKLVTDAEKAELEAIAENAAKSKEVKKTSSKKKANEKDSD